MAGSRTRHDATETVSDVAPNAAIPADYADRGRAPPTHFE